MSVDSYKDLKESGRKFGTQYETPLAGFGTGAAALVVAVLLRWLLDPWLGENQPFTTLFGAVAIAVWMGGYRPALLFAILGYLACNWLFMEPRQELALSGRQTLGLIVYLFSCGIIIGLGEAARNARRRAQGGQTQTHRLVQDLRDSEERFRLVAESAPVHIWMDDEHGRAVLVNDRYLEFFGMRREQLLREGWHDVLHPDDRESYLSAYRSAIAARTEHHAEVRVRRYDGVYRWFEMFARPRHEGERFAGYVGISIDVTERKAAEDRLRETREVLQSFMDNSPARTWIKDEDGRYLFRNRAAEQVISMTKDEYIGKTDFDLFPAESAEHMLTNDRRVIETNQPHRFVETVTIHGEERKLLVAKFPIIQGGRRLVAGVSLDVTDQMRAEAQLREADRRKDEFLATLAHELRNPLAPIRNAVQLMRTRSEPHELAWARDVIERQVAQMARLLDDLLDVSRITRNKLDLRKRPVPLAAAIESAVETSRPLIDAARHELTVMLPEEPVFLEGDLLRLAQVFSNLLNNAAKYTAEGGRIDIEAGRDGNRAIVTVRDNGIGMAPDMLPCLFEMFSQATPANDRSQGGLGIGLALSRLLVEMHGGTIEGHSEGLGKGSTFTVRLPVLEQLPDQIPTPRPETSLQHSAGRRVLVVDDLKDAADSLGALLRSMGHEVQVAYDGEAAIAVAESHRPDTVLLDLGMPKLNGYETCRLIRAQPWGKSICIVALTGWGQEADRHRTAQAGFNCHLVKPVDASELSAVLRPSSRGRS